MSYTPVLVLALRVELSHPDSQSGRSLPSSITSVLVADEWIRTLFNALKTHLTTLESAVLVEPTGVDPVFPV